MTGWIGAAWTFPAAKVQKTTNCAPHKPSFPNSPPPHPPSSIPSLPHCKPHNHCGYLAHEQVGKGVCSERLSSSAFVCVCASPSTSSSLLALRSSSPNNQDSTRTSHHTTNNNTASPDKPPGILCLSSLPGEAAAGLAGSTSTIHKKRLADLAPLNTPAIVNSWAIYLLGRRRALHVLALRRRLGVVALVWLLVGHLLF